MKEACINARSTIDIEQYIFEHDTVGKEFLSLLLQKRKEGVHVRLLCDMVGCYKFFSSDIPESLRQAGIEVRFFNVIKPWRLHTFFSWFFRDHRKLLVVDKVFGFVGGVGIRSDMKSWRDTHVKVSGPVVQEMKFAFEEMWETAGSENFFRRMKRLGLFNKGFGLLTNSPFLRKRFIYQELISAIRNAHQYIYITTPYFIPDRRLRRVIKLASRRGVDVRILVPESSDSKIVDRAARTCFDGMLSSNVRIYLYTDEMLHAKTCAIDDTWATIGSFNLDSLSIFYNYEANLVGTKKEFALDVRSLFEADIAQAEEVTLNAWRRRPFSEKLREVLVLPFRRFL